MRSGLIGVAIVALLLDEPAARQPDAAAVLAEMRQALGGAAALDSLQALSMTATGRMEVKGMTMAVADDYFLMLPDHYMRVRRLVIRDVSSEDARVYEGFRGGELILVLGRRPPPAVPGGDRLALAKSRHDAARLMLALTGRSLPTYPLEFKAVGREDVGSSTYDTVEAHGPEGVVMQLYIDTKTHLPAMIASRGLEKTPDTRWFLAEFKDTAGLNWPREIEEQVEGGLSETLTVRSWKLNPKLDPRLFVPMTR